MKTPSFLASFCWVTLSGCLWFLAVTPFDISLLAWIASVPMLFAVDRAPTLRRALFLGWWAGLIETAGGFYWLIEMMRRFADFPWLGAAGVFLLFCAARAVIFLLFTALVCIVRRRMRAPMALLAPVAMVCGELIVPQIFPCGQWISQAWHPLVIQVAELTGPLGVTALLMMVNGAIYDGIADGPAGRRAALGAAATLAAALIFGAVRMRQIDALVARAPLLKVGLVQPNIAYTLEDGITRAEAVRELMALQQQSIRLQKAGAQLIVWSEGSYPVTIARDIAADFAADSPASIRGGVTVPMLIGAQMSDAARDDAFNSAVLIDRDGRVTGVYDKVRLLAFGEYIPGIDSFPWLRKFLPAQAGRFTPGREAGSLRLFGPHGSVVKLGPVICYEDILPGYLRRVGQLHPNVLVNLTSDSWFGAQTEPWEHLALSIFASVELRAPLVRAVNSGVSAMIDPNGRLLQKTYADDPYREPRAADGLLVTAPIMPGSGTIYVAIGNAFAYLCVAVALLMMGVAARTRR